MENGNMKIGRLTIFQRISGQISKKFCIQKIILLLFLQGMASLMTVEQIKSNAEFGVLNMLFLSSDQCLAMRKKGDFSTHMTKILEM